MAEVNRNTEYRRVAKVRELMMAGWAVNDIKTRFKLAPKDTEILISQVIYGLIPEKWQDFQFRHVVGVEFGNKQEQYYPANHYSEENAFVIPEYQYSDLSLEEKILFHANLPKEWKIRLPQK